VLHIHRSTASALFPRPVQTERRPSPGRRRSARGCPHLSRRAASVPRSRCRTGPAASEHGVADAEPDPGHGVARVHATDLRDPDGAAGQPEAPSRQERQHPKKFSQKIKFVFVSFPFKVCTHLLSVKSMFLGVRAARFFFVRTTYHSGKKYTKLPRTIPNFHKN
jgi:hypothetical protein